MALFATMSIQAQVVKVYKNGTLQKTYTNTATDNYKVVFEEATAPAADPKLNIKVTSSDIATLKAIKVVTDKAIDGTSKEKVLTVAADQQTPAAEGSVYSVEIPSQEYGFYQIYLSEDGSTYKEAMASKSNVGEITEDKAIDYEKNAVQLWADGPYFATMNVGETTVDGNTVKYAWGATSADGAANTTTDSGDNIIAGTYNDEHDTAYKIWGSAWRMPKQEEFEAMSNNCTLGYISGGTFTFSNTGYGTSVSFPSISLGEFYIAEYWTSTVNNGNLNVFYGDFTKDQYSTSFIYNTARKPQNDTKYFVRAVLR